MSSVLALARVFGIAFTVGLSGAVAPGPLLTYTVSGIARKGFLHGPLVVLGHGLAELLLVTLLALGLSAFFESPAMRIAVGIVGGGALVLMGLSMLIGLKKATADAGVARVSEEGGRSLWGSVVGGGVVSLSSPYFILWWATAGTKILLDALAYGLAGFVVFCVGHFASDALWYVLVSAGVCAGRKWFAGRGYAALVAVCAVALVLFGGFFLYSAARAFV